MWSLPRNSCRLGYSLLLNGVAEDVLGTEPHMERHIWGWPGNVGAILRDGRCSREAAKPGPEASITPQPNLPQSLCALLLTLEGLKGHSRNGLIIFFASHSSLQLVMAWLAGGISAADSRRHHRHHVSLGMYHLFYPPETPFKSGMYQEASVCPFGASHF